MYNNLMNKFKLDAAWSYFKRRKFVDALNFFTQINYDPRTLILLFEDLVDNKNIYSSKLFDKKTLIINIAESIIDRSSKEYREGEKQRDIDNFCDEAKKCLKNCFEKYKESLIETSINSKNFKNEKCIFI